ncbi:HPF/RaiA family ribosome-associated protein [Segetibacter sp. 3557_3]|uniref:HPF/RaiA family ribosome-associated protein n=1 Tax=Segetibacter sp. 3557_3 TaxID=2547429 RepID=UPI0010587D3B|nr:HPF/RaiA family ribosome-associated protein [Segetibacter sp. 3557_3]TDH24582.1 HPF/RaiA family ribosome-associated protein [Segetibacter sp. 3557_3]
MHIQFNTDNSIKGSEAFRAPLEDTLNKSLTRFAERITRLEVHINDENSHKPGQDDKRCMLEARLEGMQPIAVTNNGATEEHALDGAIDKLKVALDTTIGRLRNY